MYNFKNPLKTKYTTATCVFDVSTRMLMPKKVNLSEMLVGHLDTKTFNGQVYVKNFDMGAGSLILLCKQGMYELLQESVGQYCNFNSLTSEVVSYTIVGVSLYDLCYVNLSLTPVTKN